MSDGYFDLQVNGYAGVDFNADDLEVQQLRHACLQLRRDGVAGILATIITADLEKMCARLRGIAAARRSDRLVEQIIRGIHIEGPFISPLPGFVGAHPVASVRRASIGVMRHLLDAADGLTRVVTLAPEQDPGWKTTRLLVDEGIVVSAGHTDASLEQLRGAIDSGLTMFTHLGNGCPAVFDRHNNIVQRVLSLEGRLWCSFIADGLHIPPFALANYLRLLGAQRAIVITDAISAAAMGPGRYRLGDQAIEVDRDGRTTAGGDRSHLAGSVATMSHCESILRQWTMLGEAEIARLTRENPRQAIGTPA